LTGAALDWAVAQCEYFPVRNGFDDNCPEYSSDWMQGGPIIGREKIQIKENGHGHWFAKKFIKDGWVRGTTPLIAAMRCYVASKLGDEVNVPEELK
jgi:hypothetical protein